MVKKVDWESLSLLFGKLQDSPGYYMKQVAHSWERDMENILDDFDVTPTQIELLSAVAMLMKDGKPISQKDVVEFVHRDKNTVSDVLRTLEKKGYIARSPSKSDQRAKSIALTDKGFSLVEKAVKEVLRIDERFFSDRSDRNELKKLLKKYL